MLDIPNDVLIDILTFFLCLILSAFFSASETAITSLGPYKTKHIIENLDARSRVYYEFWLNTPERVLTTILVFNNVVNILASAISTKIAYMYSRDYAVSIATGVTTALILIFGEIVPKSFAKANAQALADICLKIIYRLYRLVQPLVCALANIARFLIMKAGGNSNLIVPKITEEELEFMLQQGELEGVIKGFKKNFIAGIFEFDETKVREIMTPRTDIKAVEKNDDFDEAVKLAIRTGHSRLPVYEESIDHIVGVLFAKDLLRVAANPEAINSRPRVAELMREAFYVPESKLIIDVFKDLKRTKNHLAIVIDEHGGTAGIVTMEDILEEIVGEIQDEFDVEEAKILKLDDGIYDVAGSINVEEFFDYFNLDKNLLDELDVDADTIGGLVTHLIKDIPHVGQKAQLGPLCFEITEISRMRIQRLRVTRAPEKKPAEDESEYAHDFSEPVAEAAGEEH